MNLTVCATAPAPSESRSAPATGAPSGRKRFIDMGGINLGKLAQVHTRLQHIGSWQIPPDLFRGEGEDRSHQLDQGQQHVMQDRLRATSLRGVGPRRVERILQHIQVNELRSTTQKLCSVWKTI